MNNFHPQPIFYVLLAGIVTLALVLGIGAVSIAKTSPVSGEDIDRIVREVQSAGDNDNTVMVNVQAAAGFGIIQRAESAQSLTKTDTTLVTPQPKTNGLPGWQLILIVAACCLPIVGLGGWLLFSDITVAR